MQAKLRYGLSLLTLALSSGVVACGGGQDEPKTGEVGIGTNYDPNSTGITDSELDKQEVNTGQKPFDEEMAKKVLARGGRRAEQCGKTTDASPGEGEAQVVFDGDAGKIVDVELPSMWSDASAAAQACNR